MTALFCAFTDWFDQIKNRNVQIAVNYMIIFLKFTSYKIQIEVFRFGDEPVKNHFLTLLLLYILCLFDVNLQPWFP